MKAIRVTLALFVLSLAVWAAEGAGKGEEAAQVGEAVKVVCFGDSITYGYLMKDRETGAYPVVLQGFLDEKYGKGSYAVANAGVSGEDTRRGLKRIDRVLEKHGPQWVLLAYGTNDLWSSRGIEPEETAENLTEMMRRIRESGAEVVIATLPPVGELSARVAARNAIIREVAGKEGVTVADLSAALTEAIEAAGGFESDEAWLEYFIQEETYLHPNAEGAKVLARTWLGALEAAMEAREGQGEEAVEAVEAVSTQAE